MLVQPRWTVSRGVPPKSTLTAILSPANGATALQIALSSTRPAKPSKGAQSLTSFADFRSDTKEFNISLAQQRMMLNPGVPHRSTLTEISSRVTGVDASAIPSTLSARVRVHSDKWIHTNIMITPQEQRLQPQPHC